jgi:hypothetical protein
MLAIALSPSMLEKARLQCLSSVYISNSTRRPNMNTTKQNLKPGAMRAALVAIALALALGGSTAYGQDHDGPGNLDMTLTNGEARGYAFIKQILQDGRAPHVRIYLRHDPSWGPPSDWTWYVSDPNDTVLEYDLTVKWYGQASCPDDLTNFQINGPGGLQTQNPLVNPIDGYFEYQSFNLDTVKDICVSWATKNNCDPIEPGCQLEETFELFIDVAPESDDFISLKASCQSGPLPDSHYLPVLSLTCDRANY